MAKIISFKEFQELDLRVGKILEVRDHPNADKLILMKIDLGTEVRQAVAGIRQWYSNEELEGKTVVVIANLEPAVLRGEKSECMLLAADASDDVVLLAPEKPVLPGTKVR